MSRPNRVASILQIACESISSNKSNVFLSKYHWSSNGYICNKSAFIQVMASRRQVIALNYNDPVHRRIYASIGLDVNHGRSPGPFSLRSVKCSKSLVQRPSTVSVYITTKVVYSSIYPRYKLIYHSDWRQDGRLKLTCQVPVLITMTMS